MFRDRDNLLPTNRVLVDEYLGHPVFDDLNMLLWSMQPFDTNIDENFRKRSLEYAQSEESRMESNLHLMVYEIDTISTLLLMTGPGRIERVGRHNLPSTRNPNQARLSTSFPWSF